MALKLAPIVVIYINMTIIRSNTVMLSFHSSLYFSHSVIYSHHVLTGIKKCVKTNYKNYEDMPSSHVEDLQPLG